MGISDIGVLIMMSTFSTALIMHLSDGIVRCESIKHAPIGFQHMSLLHKHWKGQDSNLINPEKMIHGVHDSKTSPLVAVR